ncbi:MAG: cation-transporting P-type ATPase [Halapricum sp.]
MTQNQTGHSDEEAADRERHGPKSVYQRAAATDDWHTRTPREIYEILESSPDGLSRAEARSRLQAFGPNEVEDIESPSMLSIFLEQFQDNLIYLLMAAAILSVAVGLLPDQHPEYSETAIILLILFANGIFGFIQDYRAEKSIEALKEMATPTAMVRRDGVKTEVDSTELVPGDIVFLEQGDAVPADGRVLEAQSLETDESTLTGESVNVAKHPDVVEPDASLAERSNMVYMNANVVKGQGTAVITEAGMDTQVGDIAEEIQAAEQKQTPFQEEVDVLGRNITVLVVVIIAIVAIIQMGITGASIMTVLITAVGLSVAAIPESLPAIVTLTLALGSNKLLEKNALVRSLPVVEALGSVDYIVTDKTGTLTEGFMTVERLLSQGETFEVTGTGTETVGEFLDNGQSVDPKTLQPLLECGVYCNNAERAPETVEVDFRGDPTEIAVLVAGLKAGLDADRQRVRMIPFSSDRKRMTVVTDDGTAFMKGAPEIVLDRCDRILLDGEPTELTETIKEAILEKNTEFARDALRVLGFARRTVEDIDAPDGEIESNMVFLGLEGMLDPPRREVDGAVADCRNAGINVLMATGDNVETAKAIGEKLGFDPDGAVVGSDVEDLPTEVFANTVKNVDIFARVSPEEKVRITTALQQQGYNVAMTGDGVNDAPALKNADVGIAMGERGSDVAKKSSDMVLLDDNFVTIRDAISEGRHIFDNIRKVTNQLLSTNSGEVMFVFLGSLLGGLFFAEYFAEDAVVLTAVMILWVNFASDGPPAIALGEDPKVKGIMERDPRGRDEAILDRKILAMIAFTGPAAALIMLPLFFLHIENWVLAQTLLFMALAFFEILMFQVIRRDYGLRLLDNWWLVAMILLASLSHLVILYTPVSAFFGVTPLRPDHWLQIGVALGIFGVIEVSFRRVLSRIYGSRRG